MGVSSQPEQATWMTGFAVESLARFHGNDVVKLWMETATPKEPPPTAPV
jgi:hypothetical protein